MSIKYNAIKFSSVVLFLLTFSMKDFVLSSDSPYDFGLFENEPLLKKFLIEDQDFHEKVKKLNARYTDASLGGFLKSQTINVDEGGRKK